MHQGPILGKYVGHSNSVLVWNDVDSPLAPLVVQVELLDLLFQVVVVASPHHLIETGSHCDVALSHHLAIVVLPPRPLQVVPAELQGVHLQLHAGVVDHILGDRHSRGSSICSEGGVAGRVGLAGLGVDPVGGELVAVVQVHHGGGHDVRRGVRVPAGILVQTIVCTSNLSYKL